MSIFNAPASLGRIAAEVGAFALDVALAGMIFFILLHPVPAPEAHAPPPPAAGAAAPG